MYSFTSHVLSESAIFLPYGEVNDISRFPGHGYVLFFTQRPAPATLAYFPKTTHGLETSLKRYAPHFNAFVLDEKIFSPKKQIHLQPDFYQL